MGEIPMTGFYYIDHLYPPLNKKIKSDIFQLGVTLYHIIINILPYKNDNRPSWKEIKNRYDKGEFNPISSLPVIGNIIA